MDCPDIRERRLDHLYEALSGEEDREVRAHLEACEECRSALEDARADLEVLSEAATLTAGDVTFAPPRPRGRLLRVAAAAAAVVLAVAGLWLYRDHARAEVVDTNPRLVVRGPAAVPADEAAEFTVAAERVDGTPFTGELAMLVRGADGKEVGRQQPFRAEDGRRVFALPTGVGQPGEALRLDFVADGATLASSVVVRDSSRLAAYVSTDKPLYRPGEPVRIRTVALERFRLTPAGARPIVVKITDPRGSVVFESYEQTTGGVGAAVWSLPAGAVGGIYTVTATDPNGAHAEVKREFTVRSYRVPRLKIDVELDRDSYAPGETGRALVAVERAEGGVPTGAAVVAMLTVDGTEHEVIGVNVDAAGGAELTFSLPEEIESGRGLLSMYVTDGGIVESAAETIPISLGRLDVELFPEGGDLVAGLPGRVYFTVRDPAGEPAELTADVVDASGAVVAKAETVARGMGRFVLPEVGSASYRLVPREPAGITLTDAGIAAKTHGVTLRTLSDAIPARGAVRLEVASTGAGDHSVGVWCRGVLIGEATARLAAGEPRELSIETSAEVGGVLRVTVLDPSGTPRAERLVSRDPARTVSVEARADRVEHSPGDLVKVALVTRDENGEPVPAVLGVRVVDDAVLALADDEDTAPLPLHFLLGMEVEELEEVAVYTDGNEAALAVDLLLGTQGWRRFAWHDPERVLADHPDAAARIVAVGKTESGTLLLDTGLYAGAEVERVRGDIDDRRLPAASLIVVAILLGAGLIGIARRAGSFVKLSLATGSGVAFALAIVVLMGTGLPTAGRSAVPTLALMDVSADVSEPDMVPGAVRADQGAVPFPGPPGAGGVARGGADGFDGADPGDLPVAADVGGFAADRVEVVGGAGGKLRQFDRWDEVAGKPEGGGGGEGGGPGIGGGAGGYFGERGRRMILTREYRHARPKDRRPGRTDFTEVLFWSPLVVTGPDGRAEIDFMTSDSVTTFRILAEAFDGRGGLGAGDGEFRNRIPFYLEPKLPPALSSGDVLYLPVIAANAGAEALGVDVTLGFDGGLLSLDGEATRPLSLGPEERARILFRLTALGGSGEARIDLSGAAGNLTDDVRRSIPIVPRGYPVKVDLAGALEKVDRAELLLPAEMDRATLAGSLRLYPSVTATLTDGLESMLRSPGGCFEQASSSNYPNVMILSLLEAGGSVAPATARRAKDLLASGYKLLTGYECDSKGYEWFGRNPGHQALTAYGLLEFADMAKVHDVDPAMVERTREWILGQRDGQGGFVRGSSTALDSFGAAPRVVEEAYILWALTEAGVEEDLSKELDRLVKIAAERNDPYVTALVGLSLGNENRDAGDLVKAILAAQKEDGRVEAKKTSVTSSRGANLTVETTALAATLLLRAGERAAAERAVRYLTTKRRNGGGFGATQATILALRTLTEYARAMGKTETAHDLTVFVNGRAVADRHVPEGAEGVIVFEHEILAALVPGRNEIEVRTTGAEVLPWGLALTYRSTVPPSDPACAVGVRTELAKRGVGEGETVGLTVTLTNREANGIPMVLARIGLPAGLLPRPKQLEELEDAGEIAFFETRPREVTLYLDGMAPSEVKRIELDLTADVPGSFEGPATSAYLYYTDDRQTWTEPLRIEVTPGR